MTRPPPAGNTLVTFGLTFGAPGEGAWLPWRSSPMSSGPLSTRVLRSSADRDHRPPGSASGVHVISLTTAPGR